MTGIAFKRITPEESRVYADGMIIGEVWRQDDILKPGSHYYIVHLSEDYRGPHRVHDRSKHPRRGRAPRGYPSLVGLTDVGQRVAFASAMQSARALSGEGSSGDAFGPGYPLQSSVAALPAISALSLSLQSLALLARYGMKAATSAHRLQTPCRAQPPKGAVPGPNKYSSDVMDHCATRAHCANPASGGVLHSAALRCGRDSE